MVRDMVQNKKLTEKEFFEQREQVLATWKTGKDYHLDFEESGPFLKSLPEEKNFAEKLAKAKFIQYLINKYQISIFESIMNNI